MVLVTTLVGFLFGWHGPLDLLYLFQTLGGTALAASGAAALNQVFEVELDARMRRTRNRPLPGRRMTLDEGLIIGITCSVAGILLAELCDQSLRRCAERLDDRCVCLCLYSVEKGDDVKHHRGCNPRCSTSGDRLDGCSWSSQLRKLDSVRNPFLVADAPFPVHLLALPRGL